MNRETTFDAMVIGAGVHGCTVALFLARAGMQVALVDRGPVCREASGTNAGTLTLHMTRVGLIPYALKGHEMWATSDRWLGDVGVQVCNGLSLAFTDREVEILTERAKLRRDAGAPIEIVSKREAKVIEPGLSEQPQLAAYSATDGFASAYLTGKAFRAALVEAGVSVIECEQIADIEQSSGYFVARSNSGLILQANRVVLCGGVWLEPMLAWFGIDLPIKTLVNQLAVTERLQPVMRTVIGIASGLLSLKQFANGTVVIGGGWQGVGSRDVRGQSLVPESLIGNLRLACHAIPALKDARLARAWAGFEAETADAMPIAGEIPGIEGAYVCGSVHSGYTSGPYIARLLAERILGREPEMPLFPVDRLLDGSGAKNSTQTEQA